MNATATATFTTIHTHVDTSGWSDAMSWIYIVAAIVSIVASLWIAFKK